MTLPVCSMFCLQRDAPLLPARKPLQPENKKHVDEDDNVSIASSYPLLDSLT